ncbi:hypothetical protein GCM10023339_17060 [Alloalcanivorax gelatiniphagus]
MSTTSGRVADLRGIAVASMRAHRADLVGTALVLAAAGAVVSLTGVLMESGLRAGADAPGAGALVALASSFAGTALVVVLMVVTSTVGLALRQRRRETALLRTVGATAAQVRRMVSLEVALLALVAVPLGAVPALWGAHLLTPLLVDAGIAGPGFAPALSPLPVLAAVLLLAPTALLAGRLAARESVTAPPTTAVRLSAAEPEGIGTVRRVSALVLGVGGLSAALSPLFVPGTLGAAAAGSSALLLVGAAACAGPVIVQTAFRKAARLSRPGGDASVRLALSNVHGFSRRLTAVVVPLAVVVATGTMSASVDRALERAAHRQLSEAVVADLVAVPGRTVSADELARLEAHPDVSGLLGWGAVAARVRIDPELPEALGWESAAVRVASPASLGPVLDPGVVSGSTDALGGAGTVALSEDTSLELGASLGEPVVLRLRDRQVETTVVAVYDRGLGVGGYLVGPATAAAAGVAPSTDAVLVSALPGDGTDAARAAVREVLGPRTEVRSPATWVADMTSPEAAGQRLSSVLLLALLAFVALGAANAVLLSTRNRRDELALLARTGATRRQLVRMVGVEALVTAFLAWLVGSLSVAPAVIAVNLGLLGAAVPALPLTTYAALSVAVLLISLVASAAAIPIDRPSRSSTCPDPALQH